MLPLFQCVTCINCATFACVYRLKQMEMSCIICLQHPELLPQINSFFFFQCSCWNTMRAILSLTWCKQRKSTLDLKHMDHTANSLHMCIRQSTSRRHSCLPGCQGWTPDLYQHRWILFGFCGCSEKSSDTHDTPCSIQMDSHSERASSALSHVTRHSRRHKAHFGLVDFCQKG